MRTQKKKLTPSEARQKIYHYCAYQERSHQEVKQKLYGFGLFKDEVEEILAHLITEGYLNEERFARAFAGGKFRMKQWGRIKIINALEAKGLTSNCIRAGLKEIEEQEYVQTLQNLLSKRQTLTGDGNHFTGREKLAQYAIQKGFEPELVWTIVKALSTEL